ncbi:MAG: TIGR00282 family metallophosphoesterase [Clostridia bacterium]
MKFLIVGDVVGKTGIDRLREEISEIIKQKSIDFCIVNGENSANGKGLRIKEYNEIMDIGIDAITMGNHIYYRKEMAEEYIKLPRLLIPANVTNLNGNKNIIVEKNGVKVGVVNLIGNTNMGEIFEQNTRDCFKVIVEEIAKLKSQNVDYIFVDFHAEVTAEKVAMGYFLSDKVTCMFGTHTHIQTSDEKIIGNGMAYITDLGMTGPMDSVLGLKKEIALKRFTTGAYAKYECSKNRSQFNAMIIETDDKTKKVVRLERICKY